MFEKLKGLFDVFRQGSEITNAEKWKSGQITGTALGGFIIALVNLASMFGRPLPIDTDSANLIGGGIVAAANCLLTAATSTRAGILPPKPGGDSGGDPVKPVGVPAVGSLAAPPDVQPEYPALAGVDSTYFG